MCGFPYDVIWDKQCFQKHQATR